ncbi:MAG: hypothetical protein WDA09_09620, partial [Bacteriovoracaceae bacterium]
MILRLFLLTISLFMQTTWAGQESLSFRNDREGKSLYDTRSNNRKISNLLRKTNSQTVVNAYRNALNEQSERNLCSYNLNESFLNNLGLRKVSKSQFEGSVYHLRELGEIDDVVVQILLNSYNISHRTIFSDHNEHHRFLVGTHSQRERLYQLIKDFPTYLARNCYDEAYRLLYNDLNKEVSLSQNSLRDLFLEARDRRIINDEIYNLLERARLGDLHLKSVTLKDYHTKIKNLRSQYP